MNIQCATRIYGVFSSVFADCPVSKIPMYKAILKFLKYYAGFAVLNVLYKILKPYFLRRRAEELWKHLPGEDADPLAKRLRTYTDNYNYNGYFYDSIKPYYSEDIIKLSFPEPSLLFNSEKAVKWLLKDEFKNATKPGNDMATQALMREFLGNDGIFNLQHGKEFKSSHTMWQKQRKISSLVFTKSNFMNSFYSTFKDKANKFVKVLKKNGDKEIDIQDMFFSFTMDSIEKFFMGVEVNTVEGGMSEYAKQFDLAHKSMMKVVAESFDLLIFSANFLPYPFGTFHPQGEVLDNLFVRMMLYTTKSFKQFKKSIAALDKHIYKYVKETRAANNLSERKDIIANFLNSNIGHELSDNTLRDIVLNLTIAGRDTTACALSWMFFELTQNLDVQEKLIEEIDRVLGGTIPTLKDLEKASMPYLNGVVYEALRLHPPVPNDQKTIINETKFFDGTVLPAGTQCYFDPSSIGRNPLIYENPEKFNPERWIPFKEPSLYEFPVFQAGPRFCLGKDLAHFEIRLLSTIILQKFRFTMRKENAVKAKIAFMLTNSIAVDEKGSVSELKVTPHLRTDIKLN